MWNIPTTKQLEAIPKIYKTENIAFKDKLIYLHFFIGGSDWYIAEYDGEDLFFGYAILNNDEQCAEWGYISYKELKDIKVRWLETDRERHWLVKKAGEIKRIKI